MLIIFVLVVCSISLLYVYNIRSYKKFKITGPRPLPLIGNLHQLGRGTSADFYDKIDSFWKEYGMRFQIFVGSQRLICLSDPKDIEKILSSNQLIEKSQEYDLLKPWLGTGLVTSSGFKWKQHRKILTPTFHFKILQEFVHVFNNQTTYLIDKLQKHVDGESFDLLPNINLCALDIICGSAMGVNIQAQINSSSEYVTAVKEMGRIIVERGINPLKKNRFLFMFTKDYWLQRKFLKVLHNFTYRMISERRQLLESINTNNNLDDLIIGKKNTWAFLDMLLLSKVDGKPLNDEDIRQEVDTFLFAGHDTITSGITFALYSIANNPEIQKKLYEEQKSIFDDDFDRATTYKDLQDMKYLELSIKESLRMYPPTPLIGRSVTKDMEIGDMILPAKSTVLILIRNMNKNAAVFPNPDKFIPERFLPDERAKRNPFSTVTFSAGPRNCIGQRFAMLEMKCIISKVMRHFELLPSNEKMTLSFDGILKAVEGVKIKIIHRKI